MKVKKVLIAIKRVWNSINQQLAWTQKRRKPSQCFSCAVDKKSHCLLMDLCVPEKHSKKMHIKLMKMHYIPKTFGERCKFHRMNQLEGELISEYRTVYCKFEKVGGHM